MLKMVQWNRLLGKKERWVAGEVGEDLPTVAPARVTSIAGQVHVGSE